MSSRPNQNSFSLFTGDVDIVEEVSAASSVEDLQQVGELICEIYGAKYFCILRMCGFNNHTFSDQVLQSNWPPALMEEYSANHFHVNSPIVTKARESTDPVVFDIAAINGQRTDGQGAAATALFNRFGVHAGVYFNVHLADGRLGIVSFLKKNEQPSLPAVLELSYLANLMFSRINALRDQNMTNNFGLSTSEINCLQWSANGKTSYEIAKILDLSEHTVNHYFSIVAHKLGAQNRTHAVSLALRCRMIE